MSARSSLRKAARTAFERLPESARQDITRRRVARQQLRSLGQIKSNQALLAKRLAELEPGHGSARGELPKVDDHRFPPHVRTRVCTQAQLAEPWFAKWCNALGEPPLAHRKNWEFAYIAEVLDSLGQLEPGRRGLGFGVGREPLVPAFANRGVQILATDLAPQSREALGWVHSNQHSVGIDGMLRPGTCDPIKFRELVSWRPVDMRDLPADLLNFDFCWSACSLEHLGSLAAGWNFVEQSMATLAPGGIAVHTTEFNLSSNDDTIEEGPTVVYRERDVLGLKDRLESAGHEVAAVDLFHGDGLLDHYVDVPPYADEPVLRFLFEAYALTSVAIVVRACAS